MPESKFIKIICPRCKKAHITYGKASTWVKCKSCNKLLIRPKGGKAKIKGNIRRVMTKIKIHFPSPRLAKSQELNTQNQSNIDGTRRK